MDPDPDPATTMFLVIAALVAVISFCVSLATASALAINEKKWREKADDGDKKAKTLIKLLENETFTTDTSTVFTRLSGIVLGAFATIKFYEPLAKVYSEFMSKTLSTTLSMLTVALVFAIVYASLCVIFPNRLGAQHCDKFAPALASFLLFVRAILVPVTWVITGIARIFVLIFGGDPHYDETPVTEDEILSMVDEGEESGVIEESQKEMINNIFEFDDLVAGDVMTHRTSIEAVETTDDIQSVVAKAIEEGYSRMPVYEDDLDNIKGILYVKDLLKYVGTSAPENLTPADLMREAMFIPESKKCRDLFSEMTEKHLQMVVVADEYGGVAGIVTIEDLIESIMGNIQDEFDDEEEEIEQITENIFNIDGTSDISDVEELLDIKFPEGEYDTVAGYVMSVLGRIPEADEHPVIELEGFAFMVAEMDDRRIVKIIVERLPEPEENEPNDKE